MKIFIGLLVSLIFIGLFDFLPVAHSEGSSNMHTSKGLNQIQNTIKNIAKKNGVDVQVKWSTSQIHETTTATIYYKGTEKTLIFSNHELEKASQGQIPSDTLNKIHKIISQLPGGGEPPGAPKK